MYVKEEKQVEQYICSARDNAESRVHDQRVNILEMVFFQDFVDKINVAKKVGKQTG